MKLIRYILLLPLLLLAALANSQTVDTFAFDGTTGASTDGNGGLAIDAPHHYLFYMAFDRQGNMFLTHQDNSIRRISDSGIISSMVTPNGNGFSGDGGPALNAQFFFNSGSSGSMAFDAIGNMYISDGNNFRIRKIDTAGVVTTFAGTGVNGHSGDGGPAILADLGGASALAMDQNGNLYVTINNQRRVRKIDPEGIITTIAGTGSNMSDGDSGLAINAGVVPYGGIAVDRKDNLYIGEQHKVRKIDLTTGIITTVAGSNISGYNGDSIPGTQALLGWVVQLAVDSFNNLFIAQSINLRVRILDTNGYIYTVPETESMMTRSICFDSCNNLYVNDVSTHKIYRYNYDACMSSNDTTTAIAPVAFSAAFSIHPNPATSTINITSGNKIKQVTITDITGREVLHSTVNTIDVSALVSGVYFVRVWDVSGGSRIEKIIKQ